MTYPGMRPTMLAIVALAGDEAMAPAGSLTVSGWRGARTALLTLEDGGDSLLRMAAARASVLLSVENHFHWQGSDSSSPQRIARVLRALRPTVVVVSEAVAEVAAAAWDEAVDPAAHMPGLAPVDACAGRMCTVTAEKTGVVGVDVSAARPLLRALRFYYTGTPRARHLSTSTFNQMVPSFEWFQLLRGRAFQEPDLFAGLVPSLARSPISFLAEEIQ